MFEINKIENTNLYKYVIEGRIDEDSVSRFIEFFERLDREHKTIKLLGVIHDYPGFRDFRTILPSFRLGFKAIHAIKKYAVVSNKTWIEVLMPVANMLTPGTPVKHFHLDEQEQAMDWLAADEEHDTYNADKYLTHMDINHIPDTNIYTFKVSDRIDEGGIAAFYQILRDNKNERIRLLGEIDEIPGFQNFKTFIDGIGLDLRLIGKVEKYAIVSDIKWVRNATQVENVITPRMQMQAFTTDERDEALEWLTL